MNHDETNLTYLKDTIEHLCDCQAQLEWARDRVAVRVLTDSILRDLERCRRLCERLRKQSGLSVLAN